MEVQDLHLDETEEKKVTRKKKRVPKLPNELVRLKNSEKDKGNWMESWKEPENRSPGCLPHSFRLVCLGGVGRGKTNAMKNIFLQHQSTARKFKKLFIVTCDADSTEWLDCEPDAVMDEMPDPKMFDTGEKTMLIIDDYEMQRLSTDATRKLATLFRFISTHKSVSIMASYQSFFCLHQICRKVANCFIIYKPTSKAELVCIANRIGVDADDLKQMFKQFCPEYYDFLLFDRTKDTPYPIRKNIYQVITYNSDSEAESEDEKKG